MGRDANVAALKAGETLGGFFSLPDVEWDVPAQLRWSEHGAVLTLLESHRAWPSLLGGPPYSVHGRIESLEVTLLDAWTHNVAMGDIVHRVLAPTLVIDGLVEDTDLWPDAFYSTAHLSEWRQDTGLTYSRGEPEEQTDLDASTPPAPGSLQIKVGWPTRDEFEIGEDKVAFAGRVRTSVGVGPDWSASTWQVMEATPAEPATMNDLHRRFAQPLLALMAFVADHPEALTQEVLVDRDAGRRVEVWRAGPVVQPREWRAIRDRYLFDAADLVDYEASIKRWWELHDATWPALGVFAESIGEGLTYTPARLIAVYSALERYGKTQHATAKLADLRTYSGVDSSVSGATNARLRVLEASRGYWSHLNEPEPQPGQKNALDRETFEEELLRSTRVAAALLQSCLLRDLGFDAEQATHILINHHKDWPIS